MPGPGLMRVLEASFKSVQLVFGVPQLGDAYAIFVFERLVDEIFVDDFALVLPDFVQDFEVQVISPFAKRQAERRDFCKARRRSRL